MSSFIRRFLFDPGDDVLLEIESINVLDLEPPASISGVGTGTGLLTAEFENGPFNSPVEVFSAGDVLSTFGSLGYTYAGDAANNVCARSRKADSALTPEYWNGNGYVALSGKKFARLVLVRVDTSVGAVQFTRLASLLGTPKFTYDLEPAQTLIVNTGTPVTATFNATAAVRTGTGGTFTGITAGETVTLGYDGVPDFVTTFLSTDTTVAAVVARINQYAGFTFASVSTGQFALTGRQRGSAGQVRVVSASTGTLTKLGHTVGNTAGTGNVANIDAVTVAELNTVVSAAATDVKVEKLDDGTPRMYNSGTPGTGTLSIDSGSTATDFGFTISTAASAATGLAGTLPAGTRVEVPSGQKFVTMQDIAVTAASAGPYSVKIRHATDDVTGLSATAGSVTGMGGAVVLAAFSVINPLPVSAALTEAAIDAAYQKALDSTLDLNSVAKEVNLSYSARTSNSIRRALRQNALDASATGMFGRMACIRPALGTAKATAKSTSAEPGVGPYRDQRVVYNYPGFSIKVPAIASKGTAGGAGFTADGVIDVGSDGFCVSLMSQLPPEENPGQDTPFLGAVLGLESSPNAQGYTIGDYTSFKAAGICAPRFDSGSASFQSGVTSVDPKANPGLVNIARRRMADYLQDSLALRLKTFGKRLSKVQRRVAIEQEIRAWMRGLLGLTNSSQQRIAGFTLKTKGANTDKTLGKGMFRLILNARTIASLDGIVLQTTVGEQVEVEELAPAA